MNYQLVTITYRDIIQDSSWDGPDKINCPTIKSVGWLVDEDDPIKLGSTLDEDGNPCAILAIPRGCCISIKTVSENVEDDEWDIPRGPEGTD